MRRITIESWSPGYGSPFDVDAAAASDAVVDEQVELPAAKWRPLEPDPSVSAAAQVRFVDGIRRVDALVWLTAEDGTARAGLCASFAAGVACCDTDATIERVEVRRGLITTAGAEPLETSAGTYAPLAVADDDPARLDAGLQQRMRDLEIAVARQAPRSDLIVIDGPLRERQDVHAAIGYIKTHHVRYLSPSANQVVACLHAGQRTPLFVTQTTWSRYCWYLRLPGATGHPWAGVVRCEAAADLPLAAARTLADRTCVTLPRFASEPHKEPRAPQNLYPIAALERELRRRLGDAAYLERLLRATVSRA
ncbi:MAG: hypothetical protein M3N57_02935 [Actinomycetota bacterium]|nr:hypothetical protein [Actinomycetota bacterium]